MDPATDKPAVYPHCCRRFEPRLARSYHRDRDTAQLRLRRWRQFAKISFGYHPGHIARQPGNATFLTLGLVRPATASTNSTSSSTRPALTRSPAPLTALISAAS